MHPLSSLCVNIWIAILVVSVIGYQLLTAFSVAAAIEEVVLVAVNITSTSLDYHESYP